MHRILCGPKVGLWVTLVLLIVLTVAVGVRALTEVELEDDYLVATKEFEQQCIHRCPDQNRTGFNEHIDVSCGSDCYITQCGVGCRLWELALESSCQHVCNKTDQELFEPKELYCVMGCNDALQRYFKWLKTEIGTPPAPALVADSLTATSLSLEWEIPERLVQLTKQKSYGPRSYLVQWRYEEVAGDWKFCRNQSMGDNSTIRVDNLQPYTKYRFRVALILSPNRNDVLISEQSVIIQTLPKGVPTSEPKIVRAVAVDHSRISISWEPGPFPNGLILSYVLQITDLDPEGYNALKDIPESNSSRYYIVEKLHPERNYSVSVSMLNPEGKGPPSTTYVKTPPQPPNQEEDIQPTLILGAERAVFSQGSDFLLDPPNNLYRSPGQKIRGTAIHIRRNLIFISDDAGYIYKSPLRKAAERSRTAILTPEAGHNFRPTLLSVDWLNDHLYILGQVKATSLWQISRCDLNGDRMTVAYAVLQKKPTHFEVDPFNGYLFWVISSDSSDAGLFRLDLGDISNGVKHEINPLQLNNLHNLGAFTIDHVRFRVLVPDQKNNTVLSISLDGKITENIRQNTQQPRFGKVKSIALANGLFYWTNGKEVLVEDYHKKYDSYYHNAFPIENNNTYFSIYVNLTSAQPIPTPVNPPRNVQALLTNRKIKIFWNVPHLLGIKGKGAWQEWRYVLELIDGKMIRNISGTAFTSEEPELVSPGQEYVIKAAAYTDAGQGPWSTEFRVRTLKDSHERHMVWSGNEGLLRSDVIGDSVETLIGQTELEDGVVTDIAWFDNILYVVSNSTLMFYNQNETGVSKLRELESVECVTVDWIGRRLYFYNPSQQMIVRSSLHGEQHEPIHNVNNVRAIKFDALRGFIYHFTAYVVEAFRLNGKDRHSYYQEQHNRFTGKEVIGLTLDLDGKKVYWIVRTISNLELYSENMAGTGSPKPDSGKVSPIAVLSDQFSVGPLTHFSDRLLWLQRDEIVVGDLRGENLAHIKNQKLNGTRAFAIVDPTHHIYPEGNPNVNVLPNPVNESSIRIQGTWKKFQIVWSPVSNVDYGKVFYKLTIKVAGRPDEIHELTKPIHPYNSVGANHISPHTEINVTISAFTHWRSSSFSVARLFSPSGKPSQPTHPRVYVRHFVDPIMDTHNIEATFRWSPPETPNGPIVGYKVHCWYEEDGQTNPVLQGERVNGTERIVRNLVHNVTYYFRVQAATTARDSEMTPVRWVDTAHDHPIPQALIATREYIIKLDFDTRNSTQVVGTSTPVNFMARLARERKLFWVDENNELFQYDGSSKLKLYSTNGTVTSLTVDWIQRILYWSQRELVGSAIYAFDLSRFEHEGVHLANVVHKEGNISNLVVSPFDRKLFWTEEVPEDVIFVHTFDDRRTVEFFDDSFEECPNRTAGITVHSMLTLQTSISEEARLFWGETGLRSIGLSNKTCVNFGFEYYPNMKSIAKDSDHFYWLDGNDAIVRMDETGDRETITIPGARTLLPLQLQYFPERRCLIPLQNDQNYQANLLRKTDDSLTLLLPKAEVHANCSTQPMGIRYLIFYEELSEANKNGTMDCDPVVCRRVSSYDRSKTIDGLKPFTRYKFQVMLTNYYQEHFGSVAGLDSPRMGAITVFSTAVGAPSKPENIHAATLSPTEAIVYWSPSVVKNSDRVWYEIHWQTENIHDGVKNKQQQPVGEFDASSGNLSISLNRLQPNHSYTIWIQAHSTKATFSISDQAQIVTFPEPDDIHLVFNSSTELCVSWRPHINISQYKVQYSAVGSKSWETIFETGVNVTTPENDEYKVIGLQPKTQYRFIVLLFYPNRKDPYVWPPDVRFVYETDADRPSAPSRPIVTQLRQDVYKVSWEPAKDNGAVILEYALEALVRSPRNMNRVERSAPVEQLNDGNSEEMNNTIPTRMDVILTDSQEYVTFDEHWDLVYNGTDVYWIIPEKQTFHKHTFRVRARNSCGWGPFSGESEPVSEPLLSGQTISYLKIVGISVVFIAFVFVVLVFVFDVELANLRELPRRGNFIHSNNILYSSSPLTDSEIALLPQIRREQISMTSSPFLGSGAFGEVYEGIVKGVGADAETRVAIKTLRKGATEQEKAEFLQEAHLMSNFKHKHILKLIGVCLDLDSLYIIMELMQGGDLLSYLRSNRPTPGIPSVLSLLDLISMCVDVATGCRYLEEMHFVHRDLACRNCLVSSMDPRERVVKIGDFGLARDIYKNDYYRKEGEGLLPVRWMSPESLVDGVFTSQSDIWAFGVLLWEIMTLGQQPYPARNNVEVLHYVRDGGRLGRPQDCPDELYQLMLKCWSYSPEDRPTFRYLLEVLKSLKERTSDSIKITSQFPCKVQNGAVFNRSYLLSDINHNPFMADIKFVGNSGSGGGFIITPPTSSSGGSGATLMTTTIPKYLELVYDDSHSQNSKCSTGEDVPLTVGLPPPQHQNQVMPTDNGYEIPIHEILLRQHSSNSIKGRTFSSSSTVSNVSTLPATASTTTASASAAICSTGTSTSPCQDDCSSLEALLPMNSILTVKLPDEEEPPTGMDYQCSGTESSDTNEDSINNGEQQQVGGSGVDESKSVM